MRQGRTVTVATGFAVLLGVAYLLGPVTGSDLSAQVARADFFAAHGTAPVDLRWYGGIHPYGYSLVSPPLMALLGVRPTGVLALLVSAAAFAALLVRTRTPRPLLGSLVGVVCIAGNLVSGRVTYALGVAFGLLALLSLTGSPSLHRQVDNGPAWPRRAGYAGAAVGALLASATSPVAGLFVGLVGVALLACRRWVAGVVLGVAAAAPMLVTGGLFGAGGWMNISRTDTVHAVGASLLVAALVGYRPVRVGALLSAVGVLAAALVHTPVGLNATRLVVMFALPVLAAAARPPRWLLDRLPHRRSSRPPAAKVDHPSAGLTPQEDHPVPGLSDSRLAGLTSSRLAGATALVAVLVGAWWWLPPVVAADVRSAGDPTSDRRYFAPLSAELTRRGVTGRVEIPPTRNYWEAAHLGEVPLARGWLRQADIARNPLFFTTIPGAAGTGVPLTVDSYRAWLADNAVQYVAVPDADLSWVGRREAALVAGGLPYLTPVWADPHWRLYAVTDPTPLVGAPGALVAQTATSVTFEAPGPGPVPVRVRHSRWLEVTGGATVQPAGDWSTVTVPAAGRYTLGG